MPKVLNKERNQTLDFNFFYYKDNPSNTLLNWGFVTLRSLNLSTRLIGALTTITVELKQLAKFETGLLQNLNLGKDTIFIIQVGYTLTTQVLEIGPD